MKVEVRGDSVIVSGYVNAVERYSRPITSEWRGQVRTFLEKIKAGVFKTSLKRNDDVKVLLNHDRNRELANTKDGSAKLEEDNIGLRAEVIITDKEVVEKARNNQLVGWSFGFHANSDDVGTDGANETRTITDLDLVEVSILDDTKRPAYNGTSIESRCEVEKELEIRTSIEEIEAEAKSKHEAVYKHDYEATEKEHQKIEAEKKEKELEYFAEVVANKVLEKLNSKEKRAEEEEQVEEEQAEETNAEEQTEAEEEPTEEEERAIDYSDFESRLAKLI